MSTSLLVPRRLVVASLLASLGKPSFATEPSFGIRDLRDIEPKAVRFIAAQGTERMPNIALFGGGPDVWPKIKGAAEQATAQGFPIRAILVGPVNVTPALEVYAKGQLVTQPIDPRAIAQDRIVLLLRNTKRDFYGG